MAKPFNATRSVWIRMSLYDYKAQEIRDTFKRLIPETERHAWVPQTLGDQIWLLFELENAQAMKDFINTYSFLNPNLDNQAFFNQWS